MKIVNKKKFIKSTGIIIVFILLIIILIFNITHIKYTEIQTKIYATKGDTLWNIAEQYKHENQDTREYIYQIKKINEDISTIYEGQELNIIIYNEV